LGGIVTDNGGLFRLRRSSRASTGIPGVVGNPRGDPKRIADGVRVRVDWDAGEVTVLG
jgi:hypothetical protein